VAMADPPVPEPADFEAAMASLYRVSAPYHWMLGDFSFEADTCDANGGSINVNPPSINGNGLRDAFELGLIQQCLQYPELDLSASGGLNNRQVRRAWESNYARMLDDLGGAGSLVQQSMPGIASLMAGFMTLGDSGSSMTPFILVLALGAFIEFPEGVVVPQAENYTLLADWFGPEGDADGDGFTNTEEYAYFAPLGGDAFYRMAALDPVIAPESRCGNTEGGVFREGEAFCLEVPVPRDTAAPFQWFRNGEILADDGRMSGSQWAVLSFRELVVSDTGSYTCEYATGGGKALFGPVDILVEEVKMPLYTPGTALLLAVFLSVCAGIRLYRRGC
jgi:hypothetical protein